VFLQVLQIGGMGHATVALKLDRKPLFTGEEEEEEEGGEEEEEEGGEGADEEGSTTSTLRKKKRFLTSFQNSLFSGCTPIRENF